jgi:patatin-like phospholipase/acyl hydrolase
MLAELEAMTGKTCQDMFDMVGGTSTGAVIAGALGLGYSAQQVVELVYREKLPNAFKIPPVTRAVRYVLNGLRHLYPLKPFREALSPLSRDAKIRDLSKPIVFITMKDVRNGETYYVVSKGPGLPAVADYPLSGVVAASGAAPVYFPPVAGNLIDGGVGVLANPCFAASIEAMEYLGAAEGFVDGNVILISLGTGYAPNMHEDGEAGRFWLMNWVKYLISEGMDDANHQQVYAARAVYGGRIDFRRYNPQLTRESVADALGISMEGRPDPKALELDSHEPAQVELMEAIGRAYARKIDWTKPNVMPWDTPGGHIKPRMNRLTIDWAKTPYR